MLICLEENLWSLFMKLASYINQKDILVLKSSKKWHNEHCVTTARHVNRSLLKMEGLRDRGIQLLTCDRIRKWVSINQFFHSENQ